MYGSLPQDRIKKNLEIAVKEARDYMIEHQDDFPEDQRPASLEKIIEHVHFIVNNTYIDNDSDHVLRHQIIGIPIGTNCASRIANLTLYVDEAAFIDKLLREGRQTEAAKHLFNRRYIDDMISFGVSPPPIEAYGGLVYIETSRRFSVDILGARINVMENGYLHIEVFDKFNEWKLDVIKYPSAFSNATQHQAKGIVIGQLHRFRTITNTVRAFKSATTGLVKQMLKRGHSTMQIQKGWEQHLTRYQGDGVMNYMRLRIWFRRMMKWATNRKQCENEINNRIVILNDVAPYNHDSQDDIVSPQIPSILSPQLPSPQSPPRDSHRQDQRTPSRTMTNRSASNRLSFSSPTPNISSSTKRCASNSCSSDNLLICNDSTTPLYSSSSNSQTSSTTSDNSSTHRLSSTNFLRSILAMKNLLFNVSDSPSSTNSSSNISLFNDTSPSSSSFSTHNTSTSNMSSPSTSAVSRLDPQYPPGLQCQDDITLENNEDQDGIYDLQNHQATNTQDVTPLPRRERRRQPSPPEETTSTNTPRQNVVYPDMLPPVGLPTPKNPVVRRPNEPLNFMAVMHGPNLRSAPQPRTSYMPSHGGKSYHY